MVKTLKEIKRLPSKAKRRSLADHLCELWEADDPSPKCELYFETPYQLLVSVILSAQTTDKMVNRCMTQLYKDGFNQNTVLDHSIDWFYEKISTIGLARSKSNYIKNMTEQLMTRHQGQVPRSMSDLVSLSGVGQKTANVIMGELYGYPTLAVDTHVFRVSKRLGLQKENSPQKAEEELLKIIARKYLPRAHHWFILHGRYVCLARKPKCEICKIKNLCLSYIR